MGRTKAFCVYELARYGTGKSIAPVNKKKHERLTQRAATTCRVATTYSRSRVTSPDKSPSSVGIVPVMSVPESANFVIFWNKPISLGRVPPR